MPETRGPSTLNLPRGSGSYLDTVPSDKKQRILELAQEFRNYDSKGVSKPGKAPNVDQFLSNVQDSEKVAGLERELSSFKKRVIEQEEQILALLEAKREDSSKAQEDVNQLQKKIAELSQETQSTNIKCDDAQREKDRMQKKALKHRRQLKLEHNHGNELRGLVVEMLQQAEFWKARAGDTAVWRKRLQSVLGDIELNSENNGGDLSEISTLKDTNIILDDSTNSIVRSWERPAWTDSVMYSDRSALVKKYESEIKRLQNQIEKLQKEIERPVFKPKVADNRMMLDLCRKVKVLQENNVNLKEKNDKDNLYAKRLEKKILDLQTINSKLRVQKQRLQKDKEEVLQQYQNIIHQRGNNHHGIHANGPMSNVKNQKTPNLSDVMSPGGRQSHPIKTLLSKDVSAVALQSFNNSDEVTPSVMREIQRAVTSNDRSSSENRSNYDQGPNLKTLQSSAYQRQDNNFQPNSNMTLTGPGLATNDIQSNQSQNQIELNFDKDFNEQDIHSQQHLQQPNQYQRSLNHHPSFSGLNVKLQSQFYDAAFNNVNVHHDQTMTLSPKTDPQSQQDQDVNLNNNHFLSHDPFRNQVNSNIVTTTEYKHLLNRMKDPGGINDNMSSEEQLQAQSDDNNSRRKITMTESELNDSTGPADHFNLNQSNDVANVIFQNATRLIEGEHNQQLPQTVSSSSSRSDLSYSWTPGPGNGIGPGSSGIKNLKHCNTPSATLSKTSNLTFGSTPPAPVGRVNGTRMRVPTASQTQSQTRQIRLGPRSGNTTVVNQLQPQSLSQTQNSETINAYLNYNTKNSTKSSTYDNANFKVVDTFNVQSEPSKSVQQKKQMNQQRSLSSIQSDLESDNRICQPEQKQNDDVNETQQYSESIIPSQSQQSLSLRKSTDLNILQLQETLLDHDEHDINDNEKELLDSENINLNNFDSSIHQIPPIQNEKSPAIPSPDSVAIFKETNFQKSQQSNYDKSQKYSDQKDTEKNSDVAKSDEIVLDQNQIKKSYVKSDNFAINGLNNGFEQNYDYGTESQQKTDYFNTNSITSMLSHTDVLASNFEPQIPNLEIGSENVKFNHTQDIPSQNNSQVSHESCASVSQPSFDSCHDKTAAASAAATFCNPLNQILKSEKSINAVVESQSQSQTEQYSDDFCNEEDIVKAVASGSSSGNNNIDENGGPGGSQKGEDSFNISQLEQITDEMAKAVV